MPAIELFAEILLVGLLASPWLILASSLFVRLSAAEIGAIASWGTLSSAVALAFLYTVGIVVDRLADVLFEPWDERISDKVRVAVGLPDHNSLPRPVVRFRVMAEAQESIVRFLDYARSRRRILRGVAFNGVLTAIVAGIHLFARQDGESVVSSIQVDTFLVVSAIIFVAVAVFSWWHIGKMYFERSLTAYKLFATPDSDKEWKD
jgi:hypothetical protein